MKIAFLQKYPFSYFGIMSMSACLSEEYEREVFIGDLEKDVAKEVILYHPDILALPIMTLEYDWMLKMAGRIKRELPRIKVVAGYIHATSSPEMINDEVIDAVCIGEGEYSFPELLRRFLESGRLEPVDGFWVKNDGLISKSEVPSLVPDLEELPDEDRALYYGKYPQLAKEELKHFMASRGCPFSCAFCCHQVYRELYRGRGAYVRRKTPEKIIREIENVKSNHPLRSIAFLDDVFVMDMKWLNEFSQLYRERIELPFFCAVIPSLVTEDIIRVLRESGCHTVTFGVETANEKKRFELLKKRVTDQQMLDCASLIKKYGMKLQTTNLFGLPGETVEEALDNILFNIKLGTDFMCSNVLLPFPKTALEQTAFELGVLDRDYVNSEAYQGIHLGSVFKFKDIDIIEKIEKISVFAVRFPILIPFFRRLVRVKNKKLFFWIYVISAMWRYKSEKPISWIEVMKIFWRARKNYLKYVS